MNTHLNTLTLTCVMHEGAAKGKAAPVVTPAAPAERIGIPKRATCEESATEAAALAGAGQVLLGSHHVPSPGEWQQLLCTPGASGHVIVGPGTAMSLLQPSTLVGLDVASTCKAVMLLDQGVTAASSRRCARGASTKSFTEAQLETPHLAAALWTLAGVGTVVVNQWASSCTAIDSVLKGETFMWKGKRLKT
jgi:hypothetical protein